MYIASYIRPNKARFVDRFGREWVLRQRTGGVPPNKTLDDLDQCAHTEFKNA